MVIIRQIKGYVIILSVSNVPICHLIFPVVVHSLGLYRPRFIFIVRSGLLSGP